MKKQDRIARFFSAMSALGLSIEEAATLRRAEMTLHRWYEHECNGTVERDEDTGKTYSVNPHTGSRYPTPDRETGARKRVDAIMADHPDLVAYHQTDPRGCALYILRKVDAAGQDIRAVYDRGVAVCY